MKIFIAIHDNSDAPLQIITRSIATGGDVTIFTIQPGDGHELEVEDGHQVILSPGVIGTAADSVGSQVDPNAPVTAEGPRPDVVESGQVAPGASDSGITAGTDTIGGAPGTDSISGADTTNQGDGEDTLSGGQGNDTLADGGFVTSDNTLVGGVGDESWSGASGTDSLGSDNTFTSTSGDDSLGGAGGEDTFAGAATDAGTSGEDTLSGGQGEDTLGGGQTEGSTAGDPDLGQSGADVVTQPAAELRDPTTEELQKVVADLQDDPAEIERTAAGLISVPALNAKLAEYGFAPVTAAQRDEAHAALQG